VDILSQVEDSLLKRVICASVLVLVVATDIRKYVKNPITARPVWDYMLKHSFHSIRHCKLFGASGRMIFLISDLDFSCSL